MLTGYFTRMCLILLISLTWFACKKDKPLPAAPTGLTVSNITDTGATIRWNATDHAKSYELHLIAKTPFRNSLEYKLGADATLTTAVITNLIPATKYHVEVIAIGDNGKGEPASTDFITEDADGLVVVGCNDKNIYAFNARNGNEVWRYVTSDEVNAAPVIKDSVVYIGSFDGKLYAINARDGSLKWATGKMRSGIGITAPVTLSNGRIYLGDYGGWIYAFDTTNGSEKWNYILPSPYKNVNTAAVIPGDSTMYIGSYDGKVYAFNNATGMLKWNTVSTGNPLTSGLAVYNNTIYVGAMPKLYAFDAGTGAIKWRGYVTGYEVFDASPTISDNKVLIGDEGGTFYAFDATTGAVIWSRKLSNGSIMSSAVVAGGVVYVGDGNGVLHALNVTTGSTVWVNSSLSAKNIYSGPTITEKYVYAGTLEGKIYCLDRATGFIKWSKGPFQGFQSSATVLKYSGKTFHPGVTGIVQ
ncbi:MAG TPA: PQQ-binding-like beta-propeller repeat protein [Niastella sp.]